MSRGDINVAHLSN